MSEQEYRLPEGYVILSTTDLQGNIVDFNDAFRRASGYSHDELMGAPHNILRHPDMPKEAFKDMWQTIQAGRPWNGVVKNRRKNGDYYWVSANAAPVFKNGAITGYLSVRYPASRAQINAVVPLYAAIKNQQAAMPWTAKPSDKWNKTAAVMAVLPVPALLFSPWLSTPVISGMALLGAAGLAYLYQTLWLAKAPNQRQKPVLEAIANGHFETPLPGSDDWAQTINLLRSRVAELSARQYDALRESATLNTAINASSTNIMVLDAMASIISVNDPLARLLKQNEERLKLSLPNFNCEHIIGSQFNIFLSSKVNEPLAVEFSDQPWTGELHLLEIIFKLIVNPVFNNDEKVGYVVEWLDRTQEVFLENQLKSLTENANSGMLHKRMDISQATGIYCALGIGINQLLDLLAEFSKVIAFSVGELAFSRFNKDMEGDYQGVYRQVQNAINLALRNLNELLGQVQYTSREVTQAMSQLSDGVNSFSDQTQQQAAAIEQTAAAMTQMLTAVRNTAENVRQANQLAQGVQQRVEHSEVVMQQTLSAMQGIHDSGAKIGDIVSLIDSIAFQTNLLALNAAVEAARAGEHGRGFAVVAAEVRVLAQKSAEAAKDIKLLIQNSVSQIDHGTTLVEETSRSLLAVGGAVKDMSGLVSQIAIASQQQEKGIDEVSRAITLMDGVAQQSAALVEQTAASSSHVADQMIQLDGVLRQFSLSETGQEIAKYARSPLADMKQVHLNWRVRMSNVIHGYEDIDDIALAGNHHLCTLGQWRDNEGHQLDHFPEMAQLDESHARFHQLIAQALTLAKSDQIEAAYELMDQVDQLSAEVVAFIEQVEERIQHS